MCAAVVPAWAKPGIVYLANGHTVEGELEWADKETLTVTMDFGSLEFGSSEIRRVKYLPKKKKAQDPFQAMARRFQSVRTDPASFDAMIYKAAAKYDLEPALVKAVMKQESNFNPWDVSHKGAMGLMQLMPDTADDLNVRNAFDPQENIDAGARYLSQMLKEFEGDLELALAAYNAGPQAVHRYNGIPPYEETEQYVRAVLSYYALYAKVGPSLAKNID